MNIYKNEKGYITLGNVIMVGSMALAIAVSLLILGINAYESTHTAKKSIIAQSLSDACGEIALNEIKLSSSYSGGETININENTCTIEPIIYNPDGSITINTSGQKSDIVRKTQIQISSTSPLITISSWREVSDF